MRIAIVLSVITLVVGCQKPGHKMHLDCFENLSGQTFKKTVGCGSLFIATQFDDNRHLTMSLPEAVLGFQTFCRSYRIEDYPTDVQIIYYTHANSPDSVYFNYCTDVVFRNSGAKTAWRGVSGNIIVTVSKTQRNRVLCEDYIASVQLYNVRFVKNAKQDTIIQSLIIKDLRIDNCVP
jgi:hypothetical protein